MNKKLIMILIGLFLGILLFITTMLYLSWSDEPEEIPRPSEQEREVEIDEELVDEETKKMDLDKLLEKTRLHARAGLFMRAIEAIDDAINDFGINEYEDYDVIKKQYEDLLYLTQLETQYENGYMDEAVESVKMMNYPENFFIGFLGLSYDYKIRLVSTSITLLPPPNSQIENIEISTISEKNHVTEDVFAYDNKMEAIFEIKTTLNNSDLVGYIARNDGGFYLYKLTGDAEFMITADEWIELKGGNESIEIESDSTENTGN